MKSFLLLRVLWRLVGAVLFCWFVGSVVSFLSGALFILPIPWNLPLPWSGFNDFVETSDGRVFVSLRGYNHVLCYDRDGKFLATHRFPFHAYVTRLAAGRDGLIYCRSQHKVHAYSSDWELHSVAVADTHGMRAWELDRDTGRPIDAPHRLDDVPPDRPLGPGDPLFGKDTSREVFHCADGSTLRRVGNGLERVSPEGEVVATYGTSWLLRPFVFPWPASVAWWGFFLFVLLRGCFSKRKPPAPAPAAIQEVSPAA